MADIQGSVAKRRPRAANASFMKALDQSADAQQLERILSRLAGGVRLLPDQEGWLATRSSSVRDAILACEQKDSRFLPAGYLREVQAGPLPRDASEADRDDRLRDLNPKAYWAGKEGREVAKGALAAAGVAEAVAAIASASGDPIMVPATAETMKAALEKVDARLMARADEAVERQQPTAAQRADLAVLKQAWREVEQRAGRHLLELAEALKNLREGPTNPLLTPEEQWAILQRAALVIMFSEEAEQAAKQYNVPELLGHLLAMRDAVAAEAQARLVSLGLPGRVAGADEAWKALAEFHGISVATLRQRQKARLLQGPGEKGQGRASASPRRPPRRDRRQRGRRK